MSADLLRETAALMRERAKTADADSQGPWYSIGDNGLAWVMPARHSMHGFPATAAHIASWHPAVALAVADWLDDIAGHGLAPDRHALAVARAYLGRDT